MGFVVQKLRILRPPTGTAGGVFYSSAPPFSRPSSPESSTWRGQNKRTLKVGIFPSSVVAAVEEGAPPVGAPRISRPIRSSFLHLSHGDIDPDRGWGSPDQKEEYVGGGWETHIQRYTDLTLKKRVLGSLQNKYPVFGCVLPSSGQQWYCTFCLGCSK